MTNVALRPLNTLPIRATVDERVYEAVDADVLACHVFEQIDATTTDLKPAIAANFVNALAAWTGEAGSAAEFDSAKANLIAAGSESLVSLYAREEPVRQSPPPPHITVSASPAPLSAATIADARKWVLTWNVASNDFVGTAISTEPLEQTIVDATLYERALLALDVDAIAATPIDAPIHSLPEIPTGPPSGSATFDVTESAGIRAVAVRNQGFPDGFVYAASMQSEVLAPTIDRVEEITVASLDEIAELTPSRVEVWYESGLNRLPVLLVIDNFDVPLVEAAIAQWREQTEAPPDGELCFDVTAARLRLRRVVVR